jgi:alpha-L-fucosidase
LLDGEWTQIAAGTTIGHRRLLPLNEPITPTAVRLRILSARAETVADLSVHYDPTI